MTEDALTELTRLARENGLSVFVSREPTLERLMVPTRLVRTEWPPNDGVRTGNPRFDDIFASIEHEGIREPLTINLKWFVIDGNHRLSAARQLGLQWVPVRIWTGVEFLPSESEPQ